jgi:hypothetical protein
MNLGSSQPKAQKRQGARECAGGFKIGMKRVSDLEIDTALHIIQEGSHSLPLTPLEVYLLQLLAQWRAGADGGAGSSGYAWGGNATGRRSLLACGASKTGG